MEDKIELKTKEISEYIQRYEGFNIETNENYLNSANLLKQVKSKTREVKEMRRELIAPIDESKRKIKALFEVPLDQLLTVEKKIKSAMLVWQRKQDELKRIEELQVMKKQEEEAERLRLIAEELKKENKEAADEIVNEANVIEKKEVVVKSKIEKVQGISKKTIWKFKIINDDEVPNEYKSINVTRIGKHVRAGVRSIPGVEIYSEDVISVR